jgi:tetratricopeptide (TPR) repeat protein
VNLPSSFDMTEFPSEADDAADDTLPTPPTTGAAPNVVAAPAMAAGDVHTLEELLERDGMEWREAVAIVRKLCAELRARSLRTPVLLEPRTIQVDVNGRVTLRSEQVGGDPLVVQIGRLLRTMLIGRAIPSDLRLLLAQATFELPIFHSVEDIDQALAEIEHAGEPRASAQIVPFSTALLAQPSPARSLPVEVPASVRTIKPPAAPRRVRARIPRIDQLFLDYGARMITGLAAVIAAVALFIAGPSLVMRQEATDLSANRSSAARTPAATTGTATEPPVPTAPAAPAPSIAVSGSKPRNIEAPTGHASRRDATPRESKRDVVVPTDSRRANLPAPVAAARESERRAAALIAQGQSAEAAIVFDSLLLANPLYEPKASELTPESLTAFHNSQKLLLPVLAQRGHDRAKAALAAGDVDRALAAAREALEILERPAAEPAQHLRGEVQRILDEASAAKAAADEIVYTKADPGVVPPRAISRQFPATTPNGVPAHRVGTLEMIVGKEGTVEFVKLHTPLNRYHERMIVSAAKAWLYRPATKGGRPVRFRLTVTINLPENGTY